METLKFMGSSDDIFGEYGLTNEEHGEGSYEVEAEGKKLYVTGKYSPNGSGCWNLGVEPADEDNLPEWDMRIYFEEYSTVIEIDVPDDVSVAFIEKD